MKSGSEYISNQEMNWLLMNNKKDSVITRKYFAEDLSTFEGKHMVRDMTHEETFIENVTSELENMMNEYNDVVIENFDAREDEDGPCIIITENTVFYPVNIIGRPKY